MRRAATYYRAMLGLVLAVAAGGWATAVSAAPGGASRLAELRLLAITGTMPPILDDYAPRLAASTAGVGVPAFRSAAAGAPSVGRDAAMPSPAGAETLVADIASYPGQVSTIRVPLPHARPMTAELPEGRPRATRIDYDVLGSVAIRMGSLPGTRKWGHAAGGGFAGLLSARCDGDPSICGSSLVQAVRAVLGPARAEGGKAALEFVNRAVNHAIAYRRDAVVWGVADYWADPGEIARKGAGDCEDYAIAKLWALRALGFPESALQLIVLQDTRNRAIHAVLGVHEGPVTYILDNLTDAVETDAAFPRYLPIMSFAGGETFVHGFKSRNTAPALASLGGLAGIAPGEGE